MQKKLIMLLRKGKIVEALIQMLLVRPEDEVIISLSKRQKTLNDMFDCNKENKCHWDYGSLSKEKLAIRDRISVLIKTFPS